MHEVMDDRVSFRHPDWDALAEEHGICADMHYHTRYSDSYTDIRQALRLAERRNVSLAITDHNLIGGVREAYGYDTGVTVVPGIEVSTADGPHILMYFYDAEDLYSFWAEEIRPKLQANPWLGRRTGGEVGWRLDKVEEEGLNCIVSAAHPMGYLGTNKGLQVCIDKGYLPKETGGRLDAYEVICSGMTRAGNLRSLECARDMGLGYTGGTDGHMLSELGNVLTVSDESDTDGLLDSIRRGRNGVIGLEKSIPRKVAMGSASLSRFMAHAPSSVYVQGVQAARRVSSMRKRIR